MQPEASSRPKSGKRKKMLSASQQRFREFLRNAAIVTVIAVVLGTIFVHFAVGWRARDLARKARESLDRGDYRGAFLQLFSARTLRKDDTAVIRSGAVLEGRVGSKKALELWDQLAGEIELSEEDRLERTVATLRMGTDEQFARAVREFEQAGDAAKASALRVARYVIRGDLDGAVAEAKRGSESTGDPFLRLDIAKLLHQRHRASAPDDPLANAARQEMMAVVDSLQGTPAAEQALAFGLGNLALPDDVRKRWVAEAMKDLSAENLALLPAVDVQVRSGELTPDQVCEKLLPVFKEASRARRASFALWLANNQLVTQSLDLVSFDDAIADQTAFAVRVNGLALQQQWDEVNKTVDAAAISESLRAMTRAQVSAALGREDGKDAAVRVAVNAAAREGKLEPIIAAADGLGATASADAALFDLCGNSGTANAAFHLLRERLGRTKGTQGLADAFARAKTVAPDAPSVRDFARYTGMYEGTMPLATDTAAAVAEDPGNMATRVNHAFLMICYSRWAEAKAAFNGVTIFFPELPAAYQSIIAVVAGANGERDLAFQLRSAINTAILNPKEKALLDHFVPLP